jgi:hypothetical protein
MLPEDYVRGLMRNAAILLGINVVLGFVIPEIDLIAHMAGFLAGLGLGYLISRLAETPVTTPAQARSVKLRAIAAAVGLSLLVLVPATLALPRWDDSRAVFVDIIERFEVAHAHYNAATEPVARAEVIENELIPLMREGAARLGELERVPDSERETVERWRAAFELDVEAYELEAEALRSGDEVALAEAEDLHADAALRLEPPKD